MEVDVVIIGGGPSGAASAIVLAKSGLRVALIERTNYESERVGETFPPEICIPLHELGLWERFKSAGHSESPGIISCWGNSRSYENDFIFDPFGNGWHVDRRQFDRMLGEAAGEAGARVFLSTAVKGCATDNQGCWIVHAKREGKPLRFHATYIVDAVGRARAPGGCSTRPYDKLIGCVAFLNARQAPGDETRAIIEACPDGWWYACGLPHDRLVVALMTDSDLIPKGRRNAIDVFWSGLRGTQFGAGWLDSVRPDGVFVRFAANTYFREMALTNRLSVGDAAMAFDPLSSAGVMKALTSGQAAARALLAAEAGDTLALSKYSEGLATEFLTYMETRLQYYRLERRWPNSPFWKRRHQPVAEGLTFFSQASGH